MDRSTFDIFRQFPKSEQKEILAFFDRYPMNRVSESTVPQKYRLRLATSIHTIQNVEQFYHRMGSLEFFSVPIEKKDRWLLAKTVHIDRDDTDSLFMRCEDGSIWYQPPGTEAFFVASSFKEMLDQMSQCGTFSSTITNDMPMLELLPENMYATVRRCFCHENFEIILPFFTSPFCNEEDFQIFQSYKKWNVEESLVMTNDFILEWPIVAFDQTRFRLPQKGAGNWYRIGYIVRKYGLQEELLVEPQTGKYAIFSYNSVSTKDLTYGKQWVRNIFPYAIPPGFATLDIYGQFSSFLARCEQHGFSGKETKIEIPACPKVPEPQLDFLTLGPLAVNFIGINALVFFPAIIAGSAICGHFPGNSSARTWGDNELELVRGLTWLVSLVVTIPLFRWCNRPGKVPVECKLIDISR